MKNKISVIPFIYLATIIAFVSVVIYHAHAQEHPPIQVFDPQSGYHGTLIYDQSLKDGATHEMPAEG